MSRFEFLKQWKPELKALGFAYKNNMFMYEPGDAQFLQFGVSIQKNVRGETYKINPTILFRNPFQADPKPEVLVLGNLRKDGIYLHVDRSSWWPEEALPGALESLKKYAVSWFQHLGKADYLAEMLETAIREKKNVIEVIEPLEDSETTLPWAPAAPPRVGPIFFYQAAILHYLSGNHAKAIERTNDWLNSISPADSAGRASAIAQREALERLTRA